MQLNLGGAGSDVAAGVAVDSQGEAYVVGSTKSPDFPLTANSLSNDTGPGTFVLKMNASGTALVYSTRLPGAEQGKAIAVDSSGAAYIAGSTTNPKFPTTAGAFQTAFGAER
jgi:Beta-propeller repeat